MLKISPRKPIHNFKVFLTQGKYLGVFTWHYVKVETQKVPVFQNALKQGTIDVSQFGEIIYSGWGLMPPDDIRKKVDELYA
ncbi:MAG: hypothetical protein K2Q01_02005 [Rickettsiales bacterium]|nr:hypothetical protein [Rickettsiales bacterium]